MKVYLVTSGYYSDYKVDAVCSTEERAKAAREFFNSTNCIEEFVIDKLPEHPEGMLLWRVLIRPDGVVQFVEREGGADLAGYEWVPYGDDIHLHMAMWARDEDHAIKIAGERLFRAQASGEITTNRDAWEKRRRSDDL